MENRKVTPRKAHHRTLVTHQEARIDTERDSGYIFIFLESKFTEQYNPNILK